MPPSAMIDADLAPDNTAYFVIEADSVWKATGIGGGAASWSEVWTGATLAGGTIGELCRVRCLADVVYVLGYGEKDGANQPFVLGSRNGGATWSENWIDEDLGQKDYTVRATGFGIVKVMEDAYYGDRYADIPLPRLADPGNAVSPWAIGWIYSGSGGNCIHGSWIADSIGWVGGAARYIDGAGSSAWPDTVQGNVNALLGPVEMATAEGWLTEVLGSWAHMGRSAYQNMPKDDARNLIGMVLDGGGWHNDPGVLMGWAGVAYAIYNIPIPNKPIAFDVARTNSNWLYVGLEDKIVASEDGGFTWFEFYGSHGANDICVDPQLAGAIYYWSSDGNLNLLVKQALGAAGTLTSSALLTEAPLKLPLRLARDTNSGRLWAIPNGAGIQMRNLGTWTEQPAGGLINGTGLHAYTGGKLICVDATDIHTSDDYGATWAAKKGGWSTYGDGVNAHRMTGA